MAPNNVAKPAFMCKSDYDPSRNGCEDHNAIRTDFILQNIFSHLIVSGRTFHAIQAANDKERVILRELKEIVDAFRKNYESAIQNLCSEIDVASDLITSSVQGVSNELFCEGITWSRIIALFVFIGEFTLMCLSKELDSSIVDVMYECFCRLVKENLTGWIEDHGGWDGVRCLSKAPEPCLANDQSPNISNKGWAKSLFHGTVRMIGTLAQIANTTQGYP